MAGNVGFTLWDISIHAPREGCDLESTSSDSFARSTISIHAPREGCDYPYPSWPSYKAGISIHAPREGCDVSYLLGNGVTFQFQSTHPARGATMEM